MDIESLLILQQFREGAGAFLTDGVPMGRRATRVVIGVLSFYVAYLILNPMVCGFIPGPAGVIAGCFIEMLNTVFIVPFFIKMNEGRADAGEGQVQAC